MKNDQPEVNEEANTHEASPRPESGPEPAVESSGEAEPAQQTGSQTDAESQQDKLMAELAEQKDKFIRLYSEFDNYKKRMSRERIETMKMAGSDIIIALLPVLDDFERALKAMGDEPNPLKDGVNLIFSKLKHMLTQRGLEEIKSAGEEFNTDLHEAVTTAPAPDRKGKVIEELEKGYFLNGKVIRHSKVVVGS